MDIDEGNRSVSPGTLAQNLVEQERKKQAARADLRGKQLLAGPSVLDMRGGAIESSGYDRKGGQNESNHPIVVVDGANVARFTESMSSSEFSWDNIRVCVRYCVERGAQPRVVLRHNNKTKEAPKDLLQSGYIVCEAH